MILSRCKFHVTLRAFRATVLKLSKKSSSLETDAHTTVRIGLYTVIQPYNCKDSQSLRILKNPAIVSLSFIC